MKFLGGSALVTISYLLLMSSFAFGQEVPPYFDGENKVSFSYTVVDEEKPDVRYRSDFNVYISNDSLHLRYRGYDPARKTNSGRASYVCALSDLELDGVLIAWCGEIDENNLRVYAMSIPTKTANGAPVQVTQFGKTAATEKTIKRRDIFFPVLYFSSEKEAQDALAYLKAVRK